MSVKVYVRRYKALFAHPAKKRRPQASGVGIQGDFAAKSATGPEGGGDD